MNNHDLIRSFMARTFFVDTFADDDSFLRNGLIDSTGMMELVAFLEESFCIKLEDSELVPENLDSLSRVVAFIERKKRTETQKVG